MSGGSGQRPRVVLRAPPLQMLAVTCACRWNVALNPPTLTGRHRPLGISGWILVEAARVIAPTPILDLKGPSCSTSMGAITCRVLHLATPQFTVVPSLQALQILPVAIAGTAHTWAKHLRSTRALLQPAAASQTAAGLPYRRVGTTCTSGRRKVSCGLQSGMAATHMATHHPVSNLT